MRSPSTARACAARAPRRPGRCTCCQPPPHGERATLNHRQVAGKKGEISEFEPLLASLDLAGRTVTFDARHTRHAHAQFLVGEKKAPYTAIVNDNHPKLHDFLKSLSWNQVPLGHTTREKGHGRGSIRN
ncbi:hypothetical protein V1460_17030 [Streptomyces sp. SCSIO 30461]|uniref:hypothetical protein n=1 Tax=Streptomyces sp. SCSIO 30461 TaxID=3118085 RepID=UPI0030CDE3F0